MSFTSFVTPTIKDLTIIKPYEPYTHCDTIVDVFGRGGGFVAYHYLMKDDRVVYNNAHKHMARYVTMIKHKGYEKMEEEYESLPKSEALFMELYNTKDKDKPLQGYLFQRLQSDKFLGYRYNEKNTKLFTPRCIKQLNAIQPKLINLSVTNDDYKDVLDNYIDDKKAFLFIDPPYNSETDEITRHSEVAFPLRDVDYIIDFVRKCKCNVLLHIEFNGYIYNELKYYLRFCYPTNPSKIKNQSQKTCGKFNAIFTNY
jgi:hypothetical protein